MFCNHPPTNTPTKYKRPTTATPQITPTNIYQCLIHASIAIIKANAKYSTKKNAAVNRRSVMITPTTCLVLLIRDFVSILNVNACLIEAKNFLKASTSGFIRASQIS